MAKMKKNRRYLNGLKGRIQNSLSGFLRACIVAMLVLFQVVILLVLPFSTPIFFFILSCH